MGGNALKNCTTRRYLAEEYHAISSEVHSVLESLFPDARVETIKSYSSKDSYGDLDVLIQSDGEGDGSWWMTLHSGWVEEVVKVFESKEWVKNGNVLSFEYKEFQIDLIATPQKEFEPSLRYFAFNDLGNLIGRVAHSMGLKLGHDGLSYNWRVDTHQFRNIILLTDWKDILPVLGYSYEKYCEGFDTLEDIFNFVVASRFYDPDIYLLHNRNHTSRVRDSKRKTYMEFLEFIKNHPQYDPNEEKVVLKDSKDNYLPYLFKMIPGFEEKYNAVQVEWNQAAEFKRRFNGELVKQWTDTDGKELGFFMKYIKEQCGERLQKDIVSMNPELVERYVKYFYDKYLGKLPVIHFDEEAMKTHRVK